MIYLQFLIGFVVYCIVAYASYSPSIKESSWYYLLGVFSSIIAASMWLWIARAEIDASKLVMKGLYWDVMLTLVYIMVPLIWFKAQMSVNQSIGLGLIFVGLIFTKV